MTGIDEVRDASRRASVRKLYRLRWYIWVVVVLAHSLGMFHRTAMAPIADRVMADFNISAVAFGTLGAIYFGVYFAMQLPSGVLADTAGPRKTITISLLLSGAGSLIMGVSPAFPILLVGRILVSFGVSVVYISVMRVVLEWFHGRQAATMCGITSSVTLVGQLAATTPLALLMVVMTWQATLVIVGIVSFGLAALNWVIVRDSPFEAGLPTMSDIEGRTSQQSTPKAEQSPSNIAHRLAVVVRDKRIWPFLLLAFGGYASFATLFSNWAVVYFMQVYEIARVSAANFVLVATIGSVIGTPFVGLISDRMAGKRRILMASGTGASLICMALIALWNGGRPPVEALYLMCFVIGVGEGVVILSIILAGELSSPHIRGMAMGLVNMGAFAGALILQPLFGYVLDLGWRGETSLGSRLYPIEAFQMALMLCCGFCALSFVASLFVREYRHQA